jgi:hypothetical protein
MLLKLQKEHSVRRQGLLFRLLPKFGSAALALSGYVPDLHRHGAALHT